MVPTTSTPSWSQSPQGRRELIAVGLFCLLNILIPCLIMDLYPFSSAPMFADAPRHYCDYELMGPNEEPLDLKSFGLQRNYWGNPLGSGVGYFPPDSIDRFGEIGSEGQIITQVQRSLTDHPDLEFVDVTQRVIGDTGENVGQIDLRVWRVYRDHFLRQHDK